MFVQPSSAAGERVFSLLSASFNEQQVIGTLGLLASKRNAAV